MNGLTFIEGGEPQELLDPRAPSYIDYFWVSLSDQGLNIHHVEYLYSVQSFACIVLCSNLPCCFFLVNVLLNDLSLSLTLLVIKALSNTYDPFTA